MPIRKIQHALCQNFATVRVTGWRAGRPGRCDEVNGAPAKHLCRSPMPLPKFRDLRWRPGPGPGPGACRGENNGAPAKRFSVPDASAKILLSLLSAVSSVPTASKSFTFFLRANNTQTFASNFGKAKFSEIWT